MLNTSKWTEDCWAPASSSDPALSQALFTLKNAFYTLFHFAHIPLHFMNTIVSTSIISGERPASSLPPSRPVPIHPTSPISGQPAAPGSSQPTSPGSGQPAAPGSGQPAAPVSGQPTFPSSGQPASPAITLWAQWLAAAVDTPRIINISPTVSPSRPGCTIA